MIELAVFDFDGTLVDTLDDIVLTLNKVLKKFNGKTVYPSDVKKYIGIRLDDLILNSVMNSEKYIEIIRDEFVKEYRKNLVRKTKPYEGVNNLLDSLHKLKIKKAILTNKMETSTRRMVQHFGWEKYFDMIVSPDTYGIRKPDPGGLIKIIEYFGVPKDKVIMIGDTESDLKVASNAKVKSIAVLYGYQDRSQLSKHNPDYYANSLEDIKQIVYSMKDQVC